MPQLLTLECGYPMIRRSSGLRHCHGLYELFCNNSDGLQKNKAGTCNDYATGPLKQPLKAFRTHNQQQNALVPSFDARKMKSLRNEESNMMPE